MHDRTDEGSQENTIICCILLSLIVWMSRCYCDWPIFTTLSIATWQLKTLDSVILRTDMDKPILIFKTSIVLVQSLGFVCRFISVRICKSLSVHEAVVGAKRWRRIAKRKRCKASGPGSGWARDACEPSLQYFSRGRGGSAAAAVWGPRGNSHSSFTRTRAALQHRPPVWVTTCDFIAGIRNCSVARTSFNGACVFMWWGA